VPDLEPVESVAASELMTSTLVASLIPTLAKRGVLTPRDAREIYENALLMIESAQSNDPDLKRIYETARELIEAHLRPLEWKQ
jgi:hypothetical protein